MGGTGSKQEDQIITVAIEKQTGPKFIYISYRGGGEVAVQLVASTSIRRSQPNQAVAQWAAAASLRPLACSTPSACLRNGRSRRPCP